jgi:hypothetical protein
VAVCAVSIPIGVIRVEDANGSSDSQIRRIMFDDEQVGMGFNSESGLAVGTALEGF